ncbi:molybdenum cofactor guanylyltransferase [Candidatus Poribacteria bacterium]|jgi:molybdopterin-guanine dinucleotide biosynthesis protein A|nr:molybdenum cofactor guanylyltransferase [Candidatus Poribacteria bacterium]MBT5535147.1 molybdenum cofactor guanylyltransferase [Candidatus Poribacteria bacterium]MBT5715268.1 molybdenum cofactor guanylyltransferase [Candidatus Poribacteria bacterium]MBT7098641.1 molybdenum cofactor guanylyltransferase [Candidatus Poribacteria bacterium]MBT7809059.1 molybdenum cofactor guanylyltransferase [Candidatus Poribacteria bacterium]
MERVTGILPAGGRSRRMGVDKALIDLVGESVISRILRQLRKCADETYIVGDRPERFTDLGVRVLPDDIPGLGAIGGIATGLRAAGEGIVVCVACDMPFVDAGLMQHLVDAVGSAAGAIVQTPHGYEPLCAAYRAEILPGVQEMIRDSELAAQAIARRMDLTTVDEADLVASGLDPRRLFNMNTPDDLEDARKLALILG